MKITRSKSVVLYADKITRALHVHSVESVALYSVVLWFEQHQGGKRVKRKEKKRGKL
jgi:hypothetical protein